MIKKNKTHTARGRGKQVRIHDEDYLFLFDFAVENNLSICTAFHFLLLKYRDQNKKGETKNGHKDLSG
jgi:hypothetical protein